MHKIEYTDNGNIKGKAQLPASKSISNRLLILNYLCNKNIEIENLSKANDTQILAKLLTNSIPETIDCQDAGTVFRFILALCAVQEGKTFKLSGTTRLLERPHDILINALTTLGADIQWAADKSHLQINGKQLHSKPLKIRGDVSSQFVTALCLIAPRINGGLSLEIEEPILSKPYISMTLNLLAQADIQFDWTNKFIQIPEQDFPNMNRTIRAENDWSSACFFYALAILSNRVAIEIEKLSVRSIQGDAEMAKICNVFGIKSIPKGENITLIKEECIEAKPPQHFDLSDYPDLAIPLITACAIKHPETTFSGLEHLRHKESDRINSLKLELEKVGIFLKEQNGHIAIVQGEMPAFTEPIHFSSHSDHRIAMSLSLLSLHFSEIHLDNIACVSKSFPLFFEQIKKLGFS